MIPLLLFTITLFLVRQDILDVVSSKRVDMLLYTAAVILAVLLVTYQWGRAPRFVLFISKYSFNIYLLHALFLHYAPVIEGMPPVLYMILSAAAAIAASVFTVKLAGRFPFAPYLFGKTIKVPEKTGETTLSKSGTPSFWKS